MVFMKRNRYSRPILMNLNFLVRFSKKYSNAKFHKNPSRRNQVVPCGQTEGPTDRRDQAHSRFRNFENAPKNYTKVILGIVVSSIRLQISMKMCTVKGN